MSVHSHIRTVLLFLAMLAGFCTWAQKKDSLIKNAENDYFAKEELIFSNKRYRIHNNYLTLGGGLLSSNSRSTLQRNVGIDFQFHIRTQHFQTGLLMSGDEFNSNNHFQGHLGYGIRRENRFNNLAFFIGPCYSTGVLTVVDSTGKNPVFYQSFGAYASAQAVAKITYDFGFGIELFGELIAKQSMFGFRIIAFFSSAYVGPKKNINPNVRSENPR